MKKYIYMVALVIASGTISSFAQLKRKSEELLIEKPKKQPKEKGEVKWLTFEEASKLSAKSPKKIFVDVYTDWCGWCKKMDANTLSNPVIAEYLNKKYYAVKLNAESDKKINYKGKEITERELAGRIFKATGYPTTVYLDEQLNVLQPISSYLEVDMLDKILHFYGEDYYKNTSWNTFESVYSKETN